MLNAWLSIDIFVFYIYPYKQIITLITNPG